MYQFLPWMLLNEFQKQQRTFEGQKVEMMRQAAEMRQVVAALQVKTAEIADLRAKTAEIAELKQQAAHFAELLDQLRRPDVINAGLHLK